MTRVSLVFLIVCGLVTSAGAQQRNAWIGCAAVSPLTFNISPNGTLETFTITAPTECAWVLPSTQPWLRVVSAGSGSGSAVVSFVVDRNTTAKERVGHIGAAFKVTITQRKGRK